MTNKEVTPTELIYNKETKTIVLKNKHGIWHSDDEFKQKNAFIHKLIERAKQLAKAGRGLQYAGTRHDMEPNIRFNGAVAQFNELLETMKQTKNK